MTPITRELMRRLAKRLNVNVIDDSWRPTSTFINKLPKPLRDFIHDLETMSDPAGLVRENWALREQNGQLAAKLAEMETDQSHG